MTNALGIDISKWQVNTPDLSSVDFVGVRASIGTATDERYATHAANVKAAGKVLIAYHFGDFRVDPVRQANLLIDTAPDADGYALDVEGLYSMSVSQIYLFNSQMHTRGKKVGLYGSASGFPTVSNVDWNWVASWTPNPPSVPWAIWQYRGAPLDLDQFNGDVVALHTLFGGTHMLAALKPTGAPIGSFQFNAPGHSLIDTSDTTRHIPAWPGGGDTFDVYASIDLKTRAGIAVDIEGTSPPLNNRDQVYLVDRPIFGAAVYALRGDGVFTAATLNCAPVVDAAVAADRAKAKVTWG